MKKFDEILIESCDKNYNDDKMNEKETKFKVIINKNQGTNKEFKKYWANAKVKNVDYSVSDSNMQAVILYGQNEKDIKSAMDSLRKAGLQFDYVIM